MPDKTLVVFTFRSVRMAIEHRGSRSWALSPDNAQRCTYIVCTRNRYYPDALPYERAEARERHGAAFLVGKITTVEGSPDPKSPERYIVRFDEYALLDPPKDGVWPGFQNPVWYVDDIRELGIDPEALDGSWQRLPVQEA